MPFHDHPPSLVPLSTVTGGGGSGWSNGLGQKSSARHRGHRWRRRLGGARRCPADNLRGLAEEERWRHAEDMKAKNQVRKDVFVCERLCFLLQTSSKR